MGSSGKRWTVWVAALALPVWLLSGCRAGGAGAGPDPNRKVVLATTNIIADMARQVAGDRVEVRSLLPAGGDPHSYEPVPADVVTVSRADLILYNGHNLELWLEELLANAGGERPAVMVTAGIVPLKEETGPLAGEDDPHMWMDPRLAVHYVENIRDALIRLDPEGREVYTRNAGRYIAELRALDAWAEAELARIPPGHRKLVTTHDAYQYFARRYGFEVIGTIWGLSTDTEPSARQIARLVDRIRATGVPAVFIETTVNPEIMEEVARNAGVRIGGTLYGDSLGLPGSGADTYVGMIRTVVRSLVDGLAAPGAAGQ